LKILSCTRCLRRIGPSPLPPFRNPSGSATAPSRRPSAPSPAALRRPSPPQPPSCSESEDNQETSAAVQRCVLPLVRCSGLKPQAGAEVRRDHFSTTHVPRRIANLPDGELDQPDDDKKDEESASGPTHRVKPARSRSDCPPAAALPQALRLRFSAPSRRARRTPRVPPARAMIRKPRADDGVRTRDPQLGKLMLYRLSYVRVPKGYLTLAPSGDSQKRASGRRFDRENSSRLASRRRSDDGRVLDHPGGDHPGDRPHHLASLRPHRGPVQRPPRAHPLRLRKDRGTAAAAPPLQRGMLLVSCSRGKISSR
jgi:hypothetical protein